MGQRRLAGAGRVAAADQARRADRVMRRPEGPAAEARRRAARRRWRSAPPRAPRAPPAAAGSRAAGTPPATCRRPAGRPSAGCDRPPRRPRARSAGGAGRAGRRGRARSMRSRSASGSGGGRSAISAPAASPASWPRLSIGITSMPLDQRRLGAVLGRDDDRVLAPPRGPPRRSARAPWTGRTEPSRASSPTIASRRRLDQLSWPEAVSSAAAIGRSRPGPALRRLAGARLATIRRSGNSKPQFVIAARTRSRASLTAASGRPTTEKAGRPRWTSTSTRTGRAEIPSSVNVRAVASIGASLSVIDARVARRSQEVRRPSVP